MLFGWILFAFFGVTPKDHMTFGLFTTSLRTFCRWFEMWCLDFWGLISHPPSTTNLMSVTTKPTNSQIDNGRALTTYMADVCSFFTVTHKNIQNKQPLNKHKSSNKRSPLCSYDNKPTSRTSKPLTGEVDVIDHFVTVNWSGAEHLVPHITNTVTVAGVHVRPLMAAALPDGSMHPAGHCAPPHHNNWECLRIWHSASRRSTVVL